VRMARNIRLYQTNITGEDDIEVLGQGEEVLEVRRILLVPEHGRQTAGPTFDQQLLDFRARTGSARQLELPIARIAVPCGLDEDEVEVVDLRMPILPRKRHDIPQIGRAHV